MEAIIFMIIVAALFGTSPCIAVIDALANAVVKIVKAIKE